MRLQILTTFFLIISILSGVCHSAAGQSQSLQNESIFTINSANVKVIINSTIGGRVISFKVDDKETLSGPDINKRFYGSTLWLSPEGKWKGQGLLDNGNYKVNNFNDNYLHLTSINDTILGFEFEKMFRSNPSDSSIIIQYTIRNISKSSQQVAPWEVTRVPTGGMAIIAKRSPENIPTPNQMYPLMKIIEINNTIWYPYDTSKVSAEKLFMEGGEGWIAYVKDRILFLKKIPVIAAERSAPNEKNIELYVNKDKTYIELENQGEYQNLLPGESLFYEVKWYARNLPAGIRTEPGDQVLISYIRSIINN
jgi:hypothetical protein